MGRAGDRVPRVGLHVPRHTHRRRDPSPFLSAAARFLAAGLLLAALLAWRHGPGVLKVTRAQLASAAAVGLLLLLAGNGLLVLAETSVPSGLAALLVAVMPAWVVVLRAASGERPGPRRTPASCSASPGSPSSASPV